jgi:hypothetical protein
VHERNLGIGLVVFATILVIVSHAITGCSSGPQIIPATSPNSTTVTVNVCRSSGGENPPPAEASEGEEGTPSTSGTNAILVWVDNSNSANPSTTGTRTDARDIGNPNVPVSLPGGTSTASPTHQ